MIILSDLIQQKILINGHQNLIDLLDFKNGKIRLQEKFFDIKHIENQVRYYENCLILSAKNFFGLDDLIKALSKFKEVEPNKSYEFSWVMIDFRNHSGIFVLDKQKNIIGYIIVEADALKKKYKTPPNWDGTKEMLEAYNKNLEN